MIAVALSEAHEVRRFGGKAVQLGAALRAGLPVPNGIALDTAFVDAVAKGEAHALAQLETLCTSLTGALAVRSSAVGEDSASASFAGQHATVLNARGPVAVREAVVEVWRSGHAESARAYRERVGADIDVRVGIVLQELVDADIAGVLFTCNPVTGADEILIEASWGLGEAIVQGLVIPDRYRLARSGHVLEAQTGVKDIAVRLHLAGHTRQEPVTSCLVESHCLGEGELVALRDLARRCDETFGAGPHDLEWAFEGKHLFLLQRRPVTNAVIKPR